MYGFVLRKKLDIDTLHGWDGNIFLPISYIFLLASFYKTVVYIALDRTGKSYLALVCAMWKKTKGGEYHESKISKLIMRGSVLLAWRFIGLHSAPSAFATSKPFHPNLAVT